MNDLTDKLKKGELLDGTYYFRLPNGEIDTGTDFRIAILFMSNDYDKIEVLEQVPSYEQWQAKLEENAKLKSLLKECREHLKYVVICPQNKKIVEKLDQVLGEE